jgi:hypothetical protein
MCRHISGYVVSMNYAWWYRDVGKREKLREGPVLELPERLEVEGHVKHRAELQKTRWYGCGPNDVPGL